MESRVKTEFLAVELNPIQHDENFNLVSIQSLRMQC